MKRQLLCGMLVAILSTTSGCMKMHVETVIEKDGSGICTINYGARHEVMEALKKAGAAGGGMGGDGTPPTPRELTREHVETICRTTGIVLLDHQLQDSAERFDLTMKLGFDDVGTLSKALHLLHGSTDGDEMQQLGIYDAGDGNYVLKSTAVAGEPIDDDHRGDAEEDTSADLSDMDDMMEAMQAMGALMTHINDLDVRSSFTVPGDVVHSNAMEVEGRTSIWSINAANMMMQLEDMDMEPEIVFSGKGLKLQTTAP